MASDADDVVVGVDIATREVRVSVCDGAGAVASSARSSLPEPTSPRPGWHEQDPTAWFPAVASCLREAIDGLDRGRDRIVAVSVSATSGTVVLADAEGEPVGPALMYDDQRAEVEAARAQEAGRDRWESLGLRMSASFGLPKWAWLLGQDDVRAKARLAWHVPDLVVAHLTGDRPPTDTSHALKSGYDPLRREWAEEAMEALGIPLSLLPEVVPPTTPLGRVSPEAASATGLPEGCDIRAGMTDSCASQVAAGADRPGRFVTVLGTTMAVKGATADLVHDPTGAVYSHWHPEAWWLPGGASNTGGAALEEHFAEADLAELDEQAVAHGPAGCVVYPLTGQGERFPFVAPDAAGFCLGSPADEVDRYRATLEGVAFLERLAYAHLAELGAALEPPLAVAGGGSSSRAWNTVRATVLGLPLVVPTRAETSFGACILAAAGSVHASLTAAVQAMVEVGEEVEPEAGDREPLERSLARFLDALVERGWIEDTLRSAALSGVG